MELKLAVIFIWILKVVKCDESLSFSIPINESIQPRPSFWHSKIASTLFESDIEIKLLANKPQGLLFYAIDNFYRSFWIEFDKKQIVVSYYSFKNKYIEQYRYDVQNSCNLQRLDNTLLHLKFSINPAMKDTLIFLCNGFESKIYYTPNVQLATLDQMKTFHNEMRNPIPDIDKSHNISYFWIGNTPGINYYGYKNTRLQESPSTFHGCIYSFTINGSQVALVTTGARYGNMIDGFCKPVCGTRPCANGAQCIEDWRQRFSCICGLSHFVGKLCNESYGVEFDGSRKVTIPYEYRLQYFQIAFKYLRTFNTDETMKIFSIKFIYGQSLYIYIDGKRNLQVKFTTENSQTIQLTFPDRLESNRVYVLFITTDVMGMEFKLSSGKSRLIDTKKIDRSLPNLKCITVSIGDSHSDNMSWMKKFKGCIINLVMKSGKKSFIWNEISDFDKLPKCDKKPIPRIPVIESRHSPAYMPSKVTPSRANTTKSVSIGSISYIIIGVGVILIGIISTIAIYKYLQVQKSLPENTKLELQNEKTHSFDTIIYEPYSAPNSPPIKYKPPYKAGSFSQGSNFGKSVTSLPSSITATLVTPEDGDC